MGSARISRRTAAVAVASAAWAPALRAQPSAPWRTDRLAPLEAQLRANTHVKAFLMERQGAAISHYRADTTPATLLNVMSVTKSGVALVVGIASDRGLLALDEPLAAFFPGHAQGPNAAVLARVTLRHMLTMASGFDRLGLNTDTDYPDFTHRFYSPGMLDHALKRKLVAEPGTQFYYSNIDSQVVTLAASRRLKVPFRDFARDELFRPLGIDSFDWAAGPEGVVDGAAGLRLDAPAMLRIGRMMKDGGAWQGRQVVSRQFVQEATRRHVAADLPPRGSPQLWGYGYLWWTASTPEDDRPAFYAAGYGGQFIYVVPSLDLVIVAATEPSSRAVAARTAAIIRDFAVPAVMR